MIKRLTVRNFQKHAKLTLKLDPHVTTIVGPSDAGKSALLRALKWVLLNQPRGAAFIRDGEDVVRVVVRVESHRITRARGKDNVYLLDGHKFAAFGNGVPNEIAEVLNVSDLNFQGQHDASGFWFSMSPGEVSRRLNAIVDLSSIDSTLSNLASMLRKARTEEQVIQTRLEGYRQERAKLKHAKRMDRVLQIAEAADRESRLASERRRLLDISAKKVAGHLDTIDRLGDRLACGKKAVKRGERAWNALSRRQSLEKLILEAEVLQTAAHRKIPSLKSLNKKADSYQKIQERRAHLDKLLDNVLVADAEVVESQEKSRRAIREFDQEIGDVCPLCDQPMIRF